jgi:hypothetical protein
VQPGIRCLQRLDLGLDLPPEVPSPLGELRLAEMRLRWYGSPEAVQADFHRMVMQAEAAWQEEEEEGANDWLEGWYE